MKKLFIAAIAISVSLLMSVQQIFNSRSEYFDGEITPFYLAFHISDSTDINVMFILIGCATILIGSAMFGTYIYRDLMISSIYVFTRQNNRFAWYCKKCGGLIFNSAIYSLSFCALQMFVFIQLTKQIEYKNTALIYANTAMGLFFCVFDFALIVNFFVMMFGSIAGYISGFTVYMAFCISVRYMTQMNTMFKYFNPFVFYVNSFEMKISWKPMITISVSLILFLLEYFYIKNTDIALTNKEI